MVITTYPDGIEVFNKVENVESYTPDKVYKLLTSFNEMYNNDQISKLKNFKEGITAYLKVLFDLHVNIVKFVSEKSEDGYYQYINEKASSHIPIEFKPDSIVWKEVNKVEKLDGWKVRIYDVEVRDLALKLLDSFLFPEDMKSFEITLNGKPYQKKMWNGNLHDMRSRYIQGTLYENISFVEELKDTKPEIAVYWQGRNYFQHIIDIANDGCCGNVVLTSVSQFANENRVELKKDVNDYIAGKISELTHANMESLMLMAQLKDYNEFAHSFSKAMSETFGMTQQSVKSYMFEGIDKLENLRRSLRFYLCLEEYGITLKAEMFKDNKQKINKSEFRRISHSLNIDYRKIFPENKVGISIVDGSTEGTVRLKDIEDESVIVLSDEIELGTFIEKEVDGEFVFITDCNAEYLLPKCCKILNDMEEVSKFSGKSGASFSGSLSALDEFAIDKTKGETKKEEKAIGKSSVAVGLENLPKEVLAKLAEMLSRGLVALPNALENSSSSVPVANKEETIKIGNILLEKLKNEKASESEESWENAIKITEKKQVNYIVSVNKGIGKIPIMITEKEFEKLKAGTYRIPIVFKYSRYVSFKESVKIIASLIGINQTLYPIFYKDTKAKEESAFCYPELGIIGFNMANWIPRRGVMKIEMVETVCHELAHLFKKPHGKQHQKISETFMALCNRNKVIYNGKKAYVYNVISEILASSKLNKSEEDEEEDEGSSG